MVYLDDEGFLQWPLLIQYPQFGQVDFLKDCCEDSTLEQVLNVIFQHPADWDVTHLIRQKFFLKFFVIYGFFQRQRRAFIS